jgi:hypothetical protein
MIDERAVPPVIRRNIRKQCIIAARDQNRWNRERRRSPVCARRGAAHVPP